MKPILFYIGSVPVRAYSVFLLLAIVTGFQVLRRGWKEWGLPPGSLYVFSAGAILSGLVGGRLGYVALHAAQYIEEPGELLRFWEEGGETAWGAILALFIWTLFYSRHVRIATADLIDLLALPAPLGEAVLRWGCLLNGCCYGREAPGFPGMYLPDLDGQWAVRYPTQLLYSAVAAGLFALLWAGRRHKPFAGFLILMYITFYAASRLAIGFLRGDYATTEARSVSLCLDLVLLGAGIGAMFWQVKRSRECRAGA